MKLIIDPKEDSLESIRKALEAFARIDNADTQGKLDVDSSTIKCADCGKVIADPKVPKYCEMMNERTNKFNGRIVCKDCQGKY